MNSLYKTRDMIFLNNLLMNHAQLIGAETVTNTVQLYKQCDGMGG